jgi:hypothetical protein
MAPSTGHERFKKVAGRFVETMAEESAVQNRMNIFTLIIDLLHKSENKR